MLPPASKPSHVEASRTFLPSPKAPNEREALKRKRNPGNGWLNQDRLMLKAGASTAGEEDKPPIDGHIFRKTTSVLLRSDGDQRQAVPTNAANYNKDWL